jgi:hypothetical protein
MIRTAATVPVIHQAPVNGSRGNPAKSMPTVWEGPALMATVAIGPAPIPARPAISPDRSGPVLLWLRTLFPVTVHAPGAGPPAAVAARARHHAPTPPVHAEPRRATPAMACTTSTSRWEPVVVGVAYLPTLRAAVMAAMSACPAVAQGIAFRGPRAAFPSHTPSSAVHPVKWSRPAVSDKESGATTVRA